MDENETYKAGLKVRREVLGDAYVDASLAKADDFTAPLQQYLTEHAWGRCGHAKASRARRAASSTCRS